MEKALEGIFTTKNVTQLGHEPYIISQTFYQLRLQDGLLMLLHVHKPILWGHFKAMTSLLSKSKMLKDENKMLAHQRLKPGTLGLKNGVLQTELNRLADIHWKLFETHKLHYAYLLVPSEGIGLVTESVVVRDASSCCFFNSAFPSLEFTSSSLVTLKYIH